MYDPEEEDDPTEVREKQQKDTRFLVASFQLLDETLPEATFSLYFSFKPASKFSSRQVRWAFYHRQHKDYP